MNNSWILLLIVLSLVGCEKESPKESNLPKARYVFREKVQWPVPAPEGRYYLISVIDGCEYVQAQYPHGGMAHKGNCTNIIHIYNKQ